MQVGGWAGPGLSGPRPRPGDGLKESEEARLWAAGLTAVSPSDPHGSLRPWPICPPRGVLPPAGKRGEACWAGGRKEARVPLLGAQ